MDSSDSAPLRTIGDRVLWPIGLGTAGMSVGVRTDEDLAVRTIEAAIDAGIRLFDTSIAYSTLDDVGHSEKLIRRALGTAVGGDGVFIVDKGGHYRRDATEWVTDNSPSTLRRHCESSLANLGVAAIDLYLLHHPDPWVPLADSLGALAGLRDEGKIRMIGLSNVTVEQLHAARQIVPIDAVQNRFSPFDGSSRDLIDACGALGIAFLAYSPLGGRAHSEELARASATFAGREYSLPQLMLAWVLRQGSTVIPITGASRPKTVRDSAASPRFSLTRDEWTDFESRFVR